MIVGYTSRMLLGALLVACVAHADVERPIDSPVRPGPVPDINRVNPTQIVVCKPSSQPTQTQLADIQQREATATGDALTAAQAEEAAWHRNAALFPQCQFEHIQAAVNAAGDNTDILIMPGIYREEPSRAVPECDSGDLPNGAYSYELQVAHPNSINLIAILGKTNITLEGTGATPQDVIISAGFAKDEGIRCDRCKGFIVRNLMEQKSADNGIYIVDSDGYVLDRVIGAYNSEYQLFAFASDNGLMTDCEALGGGDSGIYVGGSPVTPERYSHVLQRCKMHHNALGFSGTQGNSVQITNCDVYDNAIGISFDSENDHPNFPQQFAVIENNDIHDNNFDIYAATSDVPATGPGYDTFRYPVGTGLWIIGGSDNVIRNNRIFNNSRVGVIVASNPLEHPRIPIARHNQFIDNLMGTAAGNGAGPNSTAFPPGGDYPPGGSDFFWDETGSDNCFGPTDGIKTDPSPIPGPCPFPNPGSTLPLVKAELLLSCSLDLVPGSNPPQYVTADSSFPCPWGHLNLAPYESSAAAQCGNGTIDPDEACDPGEDGAAPNLGGQTCASLGQGDGKLGCNQFCDWDFSGCSASAGTPTPQLLCELVAMDTPTPTNTDTPAGTHTPTSTPTETATVPETPTPTRTASPTETTAPTLAPSATPTVTEHPPIPTATVASSATPNKLGKTGGGGCAVQPGTTDAAGAWWVAIAVVAAALRRTCRGPRPDDRAA